MENIIEFPKLGLEFNINENAFEIGSLVIKWYGIIICLGFLVSLFLAMRSCEKYGITKDDLLDYLLFAMPFAIVGARLYYVVLELDQYKSIKDVLNIRQGGLAVYGGIIAAVITVIIVSKVKKKSVLTILDFSMPYIMLGQAIGRWGNFTNQEAFGSPTKLPWGMTGNIIKENLKSLNISVQSLVHPTFLYESLVCLAGFIFMMVYRKKWRKSTGELLALYMIIYGLNRAMIESLRLDSLYIGNTDIRASQLLSVILFILGIAFFIDVRRKYNKKIIENSEEQSTLAGIVEEIQKTEDEENILKEAEELEAQRQNEMTAYEISDKENKR